jgi:hypothetical protein
MRMTRALGSNRDLPQVESFYSASAAAGTGTDYEHPILVIPDLTKLLIPSGSAGDQPYNDLYVRSLMITPEAAVTGAATNNYLWGFRQYRAGSVINQINTTNTGSISTGAQTVTPATGTLMQYIAVGTVLHIAAGGGTAEDVIVTAVTSATFTATFGFTHTAGTAITGVYLAATWYNGGTVTEAAYTTRQYTPIPNQFLPGDVLTFRRISYGTGLSGGSPNVTAIAEWVLLYNNLPMG